MCQKLSYIKLYTILYVVQYTTVSIIPGVFLLLLTYLPGSGWGQSVETPAWVCDPNATPGPQATPSQTSFYLTINDVINREDNARNYRPGQVLQGKSKKIYIYIYIYLPPDVAGGAYFQGRDLFFAM